MPLLGKPFPCIGHVPDAAWLPCGDVATGSSSQITEQTKSLLWDLRYNPEELIGLGVDEIQERMFSKVVIYRTASRACPSRDSSEQVTGRDCSLKR